MLVYIYIYAHVHVHMYMCMFALNGGTFLGCPYSNGLTTLGSILLLMMEILHDLMHRNNGNYGGQ